jgi:LuxR family maltose regulon positive regulatory protein
MADLAQRATTVGASTGRWDDGIESGTLSVLLVGYADLVRCRPQECLDGLAGTDAYAQRLGPAVVLTPFLDALRAAARFDLGERETGFTLMHHARAATVVVRARDEQVALVAVLAYGMARRLGRRDEATAIVRLDGHPAGGHRRAGRHARDRTRHDQPLRREAWLIECGMCLRTGQPERAGRALATALRICREVGVLRPLTTTPAAVTALLRNRAARHGGLAAEALAVHQRLGPVDAPTLTAREQAVLAQLSSLRTLAEIAADLGVSVNTVKTHVTSLHAKLGAGSRREAVEHAGRRAGDRRSGISRIDVTHRPSDWMRSRSPCSRDSSATGPDTIVSGGASATAMPSKTARVAGDRWPAIRIS